MKILSSVIIVYLVLSLTGCLESSFELSDKSRLPKWFSVPEETLRSDIKVTLDYYADGEATFKLFNKEKIFNLEEFSGDTLGDRPIKLKSQSSDYPMYQIVTIKGITEIIEHRKMEPVFYVTDDPVVWKEFEGYIEKSRLR